MKRVILDFETRSACDLKKSGGYKYSVDPTTQATCLGFKVVGDKHVELLPFDLVNKPFDRIPIEIQNRWRALIKSGYQFSAHNVFFDLCIYKNVMVKRFCWPDIPFNQFRCTAAKAAACALPRALEKAGEAMKLKIQKDRTGFIVMMKTCKPTREWSTWQKKFGFMIGAADAARVPRKYMVGETEPKMFVEPEDDPRLFDALYTYCKFDVRSEEELDSILPDLIPIEEEIRQLNTLLNWRGVRVELSTVRNIVAILNSNSKERLKELDTLTMGLVKKAGARRAILDFLAIDDIEMPDIRATTVDEFLKNGKATGDMKRLLEIRKELAKTSTKKYQAMINRACDDGRVRDVLMYHGASTGRDSGTGVQFHNLPRPAIKQKEIEDVISMVKRDDVASPEWIKFFYGDLGIVFSSLLRGMLIPSPSHELFVADFSKIEVAVLWWLADNLPGLAILRKGLDPYKYQASASARISYEKIRDDSDLRQLGKALVLACGFGMGWRKFQKTAYAMYGLALTDEEAQAAVRSYRESNEAVPVMWRALEDAALQVVTGDKSSVTVNKCTFQMHNDFLTIVLPSGRALMYKDPQIVMRDTDWGEQPSLEFWAVNSKTKKWSIERTWGGTLTENVVQAVARDLMMWASIRLEKAGYKMLLTVHDEAICEREKNKGSLEEFTKIMCYSPKWAAGCPIDAKGWIGGRYKK